MDTDTNVFVFATVNYVVFSFKKKRFKKKKKSCGLLLFGCNLMTYVVIMIIVRSVCTEKDFK